MQLLEGAEVSNEAIEGLISFGFICAPETLYKDVYKLPRWTYLKISKSENRFEFCPIKILNDAQTFRSLQMEFDHRVDQLDLLEKGESNLTLAFSGGLDSSVLHSLLKTQKIRHNLYCVNVVGGRDESRFQDLCLDKNEHISRTIMSEYDANDAFERHINRKEIFGSSIALKYEFMYKDLSLKGAEAVLTGDGPDELFVSFETKNRLISNDGRLMTAFEGTNNRPLAYFGVNDNRVSDIWYAHNYILASETNIYFEHVIASDYRIKLKMPYLEADLLTFCANNSSRILHMGNKELLKNYARHRIPIEIIQREKKGFTSDVAIWFQHGKVFYERAKMLTKLQYPTAYAKKLTDTLSDLLELHSVREYNPQVRTNGNGEINKLYAIMLALSWIKNIEKENTLDINFQE
jgi:asparagine synthetase B (glutamine-hydrolysing)